MQASSSQQLQSQMRSQVAHTAQQLIPSLRTAGTARMKSSHVIMQRAFAGRKSMSSKRKKNRAAFVEQLRKRSKPFVVVSECSSPPPGRHVGHGRNDEKSKNQTSLQNGRMMEDADKKNAEKFVVQYDEIVLVAADGLQAVRATVSPISELAANVQSVLMQALGRRVTSVVCQTLEADGKEHLMIGLIPDQKFAYENVIRGPAANDARLSADFRKLWGKWSECRRFPDLSTCEAVYFPSKTLAEKRNITQTIVEHILKEHFKISAKHVVSLSSQVNQMLKPPHVPAPSYGTGEEVLTQIGFSLEDLIKKMRQLKSLPLSVTAVQGISAVFRGGEVWPRPAGHETTDAAISDFPNHVFEVVMNLESSGKWPDELNALRAVKYQFISETCAKFEKELGIPCRPSSDYFDAFHDGHLFRIIPSVKKEVTLLRQIKSRTGVLIAGIGSSEEAESLYTQNDILPKLTGALNGISTRFMSYNTSCRLAKRWISSQFMDGYVDELIIELLVAQTYIAADAAPSSPLSGFRSFLRLISTFPFAKEPLLVNLNQSFSERDVENVKSFYRRLEHKPFLYVVTPYDRRFGMFCKVRGSVNSAGVIKLLIECASKCERLLLSLLSDPHAKTIASLFHHHVEKPHVVIHLKKNKKTQPVPSASAVPAVCSHPVRDLLNNLRRIFDDFAVFLCDFYGGSDIIVYWKSLAFHNKPVVKTSLADKMLVEPFVNEADGTVTLNIEAFVELFACVGEGIVHNIEVRAENWPV